ncbi:uncharacterized protein LOC130589513 [Beta vulgaris subsp. vulgaris]|uniref:uncharacterized protein LOC130589513 n=1 Tax=Beta vulgaris subsp. vulgaris TaxID=3555 RepID=UPI0025485EEC|nr:uncharacterized protein LOC130589513 [Beta vulgaris subsp. vulgaris]
MGIPRHQFCSWLATQGRLMTREKLHSWGVCDSDKCLICDEHTEDHRHLFFDCEYSRRCLSEIKQWCGVTIRSQDWQQVIHWLVSRRRDSKYRRMVQAAALEAVIYCIWQARNLALWEGKIPCIAHTVKKIKCDVKHRCITVMPKKISQNDRRWIEAL